MPTPNILKIPIKHPWANYSKFASVACQNMKYCSTYKPFCVSFGNVPFLPVHLGLLYWILSLLSPCHPSVIKETIVIMVSKFVVHAMHQSLCSPPPPPRAPRGILTDFWPPTQETLTDNFGPSQWPWGIPSIEYNIKYVSPPTGSDRAFLTQWGDSDRHIISVRIPWVCPGMGVGLHIDWCTTEAEIQILFVLTLNSKACWYQASPNMFFQSHLLSDKSLFHRTEFWRICKHLYFPPSACISYAMRHLIGSWISV